MPATDPVPRDAQNAALRVCVEHLVELIRARGENPPGDERAGAAYIQKVLRTAGVEPLLLEPAPRRQSVIARLHGDGTGGGALLLLGHLDVVPADAEGWTAGPFAGVVRNGYVFGRGAVDMKSMVAMELQVFVELAQAARARGLDPTKDVIPGLRRDVILAATADEETGGRMGMGWIVRNAPEIVRADAALNEAGGFSVALGRHRLYPIQVSEKGKFIVTLTVKGMAGHGSMPNAANAAVFASQVVARLAAPRPADRRAPVLGLVGDLRRMLREEGVKRASRLRLEDPATAWALGSLLRDSISPNMIHAGIKYNMIPGTATVVVDCRVLPGTTETMLLERLRRLVGDDLWSMCSIEVTGTGTSYASPADHPIVGIIAAAVREADPEAIPVPCMAPFSTDAKHTVPFGIPTYGFTPFRFEEGGSLLRFFHATDERISVSAMGWGLGVLRRVVRGYCGDPNPS